MLTSLASATRVVLLPTTSPASAPTDDLKIRRYKLARLRQDAPSATDRHAHLRRSHD